MSDPDPGEVNRIINHSFVCEGCEKFCKKNESEGPKRHHFLSHPAPPGRGPAGMDEVVLPAGSRKPAGEATLGNVLHERETGACEKGYKILCVRHRAKDSPCQLQVVQEMIDIVSSLHR